MAFQVFAAADPGAVRDLTDHEIAWVSGGEAGLNYAGGTVTGPCMSLANARANGAMLQSIGKDAAAGAALGLAKDGASGALAGGLFGLVSGVVKYGYDLLTGAAGASAPVCDGGAQAGHFAANAVSGDDEGSWVWND